MRHFGDILLGLGLIVGIGAIVGYQLDIIPTLPPIVLKLVLYKPIFLGGVGLLVAGAFIRRLANRIETLDTSRKAVGEHDNGHVLPLPPASEVIRREIGLRDKPPLTR